MAEMMTEQMALDLIKEQVQKVNDRHHKDRWLMIKEIARLAKWYGIPLEKALAGVK